MWIEEIKNIKWTNRNDMIIQFMAISDHFYDRPYAYCCEVWELISDWMGDCNFVPENDAILLSATLYIKGVAYPIERIGLNDLMTFEVLMNELTCTDIYS